MLKKKRFLIGGIIIFLAIGYLSYISFTGSAIYYYTVSELSEQGNVVYQENIRVNGEVTPGSVEQEPGGLGISFTIAEGGTSLPVVYQGVVPDAFEVGNEVVVEGHLNSSSIFQAHTILVKCPSKYEPKQ